MFEKFFMYICNTMALPSKVLSFGQTITRGIIVTIECATFVLCTLRVKTIPGLIMNALNCILAAFVLFK